MRQAQSISVLLTWHRNSWMPANMMIASNTESRWLPSWNVSNRSCSSRQVSSQMSVAESVPDQQCRAGMKYASLCSLPWLLSISNAGRHTLMTRLHSTCAATLLLMLASCCSTKMA
jgi:hypothetical protein